MLGQLGARNALWVLREDFNEFLLDFLQLLFVILRVEVRLAEVVVFEVFLVFDFVGPNQKRLVISKQIILDTLLDHLGQSAQRELLQDWWPTDLDELGAAIPASRDRILRLVQKPVWFASHYHFALHCIIIYRGVYSTLILGGQGILDRRAPPQRKLVLGQVLVVFFKLEIVEEKLLKKEVVI